MSKVGLGSFLEANDIAGECGAKKCLECVVVCVFFDAYYIYSGRKVTAKH